MKELQLLNDKIEVNVKKRQEIEYVLEGTIEPKRGHKVWEVNKITGEVKQAEYKNNTIGLNVQKENEKLVVNPDCVYIPALNATTAKAKYLKNNNQAIYYKKEAPMKLSDITF